MVVRHFVGVMLIKDYRRTPSSLPYPATQQRGFNNIKSTKNRRVKLIGMEDLQIENDRLQYWKFIDAPDWKKVAYLLKQ